MTGDMFVPNGHRRRIKHYHDPGDLHELTFSCHRREVDDVLPRIDGLPWEFF